MCIIDSVSDISELVTNGMKDPSFFSPQLYDNLFNKALKLMPTTKSSESVKLIKVFDFDEKREYLEKFTGRNS